MCQVESVYFVVDGVAPQPPCLAHEHSISQNIEMQSKVTFFSNETYQEVYVSFVWQLPDNTIHVTWANNGNSYFIGDSGTYTFTASNFMQWNQQGNYNLIRVQILDAAKVNLLCCGGGTNCNPSNYGCMEIYVSTLPLTCQALYSSLLIPTSVQQGTSTSVTITPSGGTPPYRYDFIVDNVIKSTWTGMTTAQTFNWGFNESTGTHSYSAKITDSCTYAGGPVISTDSHNVIITAKPPPGITYSCINNTCKQSTCTVGSQNCYSTSNCNNVCLPPTTLGCVNCDTTKNYCISGSCIPKSYVVLGAVGFFALMILRG